MTREKIAQQRKENPAAFNAAVFAALPVPRGFVCPRCGSAWHRENGGHLACGDAFGNGCEWQGTWGEVAPPDFAGDPAQDYKVLCWVREKWNKKAAWYFSIALSRPVDYQPGDYAVAALLVLENCSGGAAQESA